MKSKYQWEWEFQERRFERAKRKAEKHIELASKHIRLIDAWANIMQDAADEQKRICREEAGEE